MIGECNFKIHKIGRKKRRQKKEKKEKKKEKKSQENRRLSKSKSKGQIKITKTVMTVTILVDSQNKFCMQVSIHTQTEIVHQV